MRRTLIISSLLLVLLATASAASASVPCLCPGNDLRAQPTNAATGVPTNTRVVLWWRFLDPASLTLTPSSGGAPVDLATETLDDGATIAIPQTTLSPNTAYTLEGTTPDGITRYTTTFTTGSSDDTTAPTASRIEIVPEGMPGACERHVAASVSADISDDTTPESGLLYRITLESPGAEPWTLIVDGSAPMFGDSAIGGPNWVSCLKNAPGATAPGQSSATITALDWAGNAAPATALTPFQYAAISASGGPIPGLDDCCTSSILEPTATTPRSAALSLLALLTLGFLASRRRRGPGL